MNITICYTKVRRFLPIGKVFPYHGVHILPTTRCSVMFEMRTDSVDSGLD